MDEEHLSARFDKLLKRYQARLDELELDLPSPDDPPAPEKSAPLAELPAIPPSEPLYDPEDSLPKKVYFPPPAREPAPRPAPEPAPAQAVPIRPESPPPAPVAELPAWQPPTLKEEKAPAKPEQPKTAPPPAAAKAAAGATRGRRPWLALLAALLVTAGAAAWWAYRRMEQPAYRSFVLSGAGARGLAWRDGRLVAVDAQSQALVSYAPDGSRQRLTESLSNPAVAGLTWVDRTFWSTEQGRSAIYQHDAGEDHRVSRVYATPDRRPRALDSDGENMWAGDAETPQVYRYLIGHSLNGISLTPLNQYSVPGTVPAGLFSSDGLLWVLDSQGRRLTRYRYDAGSLNAVDKAELDIRLAAGASVLGMVASPAYLWVLTGVPEGSHPATLHRFSRSRLAWEPPAAEAAAPSGEERTPAPSGTAVP